MSFKYNVTPYTQLKDYSVAGMNNNKSKSIDIYHKSTELLEKLANSIYDREPNNPNPFFFNMQEIHIVERWLKDLLENN